MKKYIIGFDGGGTRTRACIANSEGKVIGSGFGGPANYRNVGLAVMRSSLADAMSQALQEASIQPEHLSHAVIGLAGAATEDDLAKITGYLGGLFDKQTHFHVTHDLRIALLAATRGNPGIVAIAGTGSACYGLDAHGNEARFRNEDIGSGFWLGREYANPETLGERDQVARIAPQVLSLSQSGDHQATNIVDRGAAGIANLIRQAIDSLPMEKPIIVLAGGVFENSEFYRIKVIEKLREQCAAFEIHDQRVDPVFGAVWLANHLAKHYLAANNSSGSVFTAELIWISSNHACPPPEKKSP